MVVVGVLGVIAIEVLIGHDTWGAWGLALLVVAPSVNVLTTALDPEDRSRPVGPAGWALRYVAVAAALVALLTYLGLGLALVGVPMLGAVLLGMLAVVFTLGALGGALQVYAGVALGMVVDAAGVQEAAVQAVASALMAATLGAFGHAVWTRSEPWLARAGDAYLRTMQRLER